MIHPFGFLSWWSHQHIWKQNINKSEKCLEHQVLRLASGDMGWEERSLIT